MQTFLSYVIEDILSKPKSISEYTFVLPSKRAGIFLKEEIRKKSTTSLILPSIISIEDLISELSSLELIDNVSLLFSFYKVYCNITPEDIRDDFDVFTKWASTALQDFNEIDRHLVDTPYLFDYLKDIDQLERWSLEKGKETSIVKNYIFFFERLQKYYDGLKKDLLASKCGYQGLQYREATNNLNSYLDSNTTEFVFVGFNALNKAEEMIFQKFLESGIATIYWDADSYYFTNNQASSFFKKYKNNWKYYQKNDFNWIQNNFEKEKEIHVIGAPKNNTQMKYAGELLSKVSRNNFQSTALVLADESLLPLTLNSLPKEVGAINITMGYDLNNMPVAQFFNAILKLHVNAKKDKNGSTFYFKEVIHILNHPLIKKLGSSENLVSEILKNNYIFIDETLLANLTKSDHQFSSILYLFSNWNNDANKAINYCKLLIDTFEKTTDAILENEFLCKLKSVFQQIETLNSEFGYIKNIKTLQDFYQQLLLNEKLSFKGEPLSGLQLMGMLETRVLDFETVLLTSVNEGVLPAGKSDNSFIPFDVKKDPKVNLPTYQEKDAIFAYHFYRLLQRAKNVYLLYNTESDHYGSGEQSRFITQLEINNPSIVTKYLVSPKLITTKSEIKQIIKVPAIIDKLYTLSQKGISPTSLTNYIYNPIAFYNQKILGIREVDDIEETIAANTLGTIIHKTLEALYLPFKGEFVSVDDMKQLRKKVDIEVKKWFEQEYKNGDISSGKNLLIYNVAKQFVSNFLHQEIEVLEQGKKLKILELEHQVQTLIRIEGIDFPILLKGEADRIDILDGVIRIIDYKTGKVEHKDVTVKDWTLITTDYKKYSKSFQVLLYAFMYGKMNAINFDQQAIESGIVSFKNLKAGFMKVNRKVIDSKDMDSFVNELKQLILEMYNKEIPFKEKENLPF